MRRCLSYIPLLVLCIAPAARGSEPSDEMACDVIFSATHVVILSPDKPHRFKVERSYRGDLAVGSTIDLPTFEPVRDNHWGEREPLPLTANTRILLFLRRAGENPPAFTYTPGGWAYYFCNVDEIDEFDRIAAKALAVYKTWQDARDLPDPSERIRALFPYVLETTHTRFREGLAVAELARLGPASGDYLVSLLPDATARDRHELLWRIGDLQSPRAHAAAVAEVDLAQRHIRDYLDSQGLEASVFETGPNRIPAEIRECYWNLGCALHSIYSFHDKDDTPYFRQLIPFLLAVGLESRVQDLVDAMKQSPAPASVPVLISIWNDYKSQGRPPGDEGSLPIKLAGALGAQKDRAAIPTLLEIVDRPTFALYACDALRQLNGKQFQTAAEYKAWYADPAKPAAKSEDIQCVAPGTPAGGSYRCYPRRVIRCR
ncbi:MAG TPA: hypothetical protein VHY91_16425 [Pirellulales bacterium]|jgi:hypothetical protein|nr:hypothetical protein [Pirellulales bacterium]